jgi:hypothetical protein
MQITVRAVVQKYWWGVPSPRHAIVLQPPPYQGTLRSTLRYALDTEPPFARNGWLWGDETEWCLTHPNLGGFHSVNRGDFTQLSVLSTLTRELVINSH